MHYTPKHGSWLNQAEIEISLFSRQCLGQRRLPSLEELQHQAHAWNRKMNAGQVTIDWKFTRKKARQKFACKRNKFTRSRYLVKSQFSVKLSGLISIAIDCRPV